MRPTLLILTLSTALTACASLDRYPVTGGGYAAPPLVAASLEMAGDNAPELEATLEHFAALGDPQKLAAAEFLIENMEGQGYSKIELVDTDGEVVPYQALDHGNYDGALAELDRLEAEHGSLDFKGTEFINDLDVVTADFLIDSIDTAFATWRTNPWSKSIDFDTFCETILPYRGSNEPLEAWRPLVIERLAPVATELGQETDTKTAAARVNREVGRWLGFDSIFYIHPTDMGYDEMVQRGQGRCEDITNMNTYAMRAGGLPSAADYTPYWADRDNNHAWPVVLDEHGEGHAPLSARAAKVYRKTFALQRGGLSFDLGEGESAPKWLDRKHFTDVTSQYVDVSAFDVDFDVAPPATSHHAYLAVFNAGDWHAIAWAKLNVDKQRAHFEDIGRDIVYLPSYFDGALVPGAAPFFLHKDESRTSFPGKAAAIEVSLVATNPGKLTLAEDGTPVSRLEVGATYTLSIWKDGGWQELGKQTPKSDAAIKAKLPADGLFWLVKDDSRLLERPFMIADGMQVFR